MPSLIARADPSSLNQDYKLTHAMASTEAWRSYPVPVPFVLGSSLTPAQLKVMARHWLSSSEVAVLEDDRSYHVALLDYSRQKGHEWTFLRTYPSGELRYLWVVYVIPSWDGSIPTPKMPDESTARVLSMVWVRFGGHGVREVAARDDRPGVALAEGDQDREENKPTEVRGAGGRGANDDVCELTSFSEPNPHTWRKQARRRS
ncbi:hypothetical protein FB451DRAFT_1232544 [Mycena latifolia]|nr:hypothetical protein FB451DRAFT_1232544 [Mycena latifolia]